MFSFKADYAKNHKELFADIFGIIKQHTDVESIITIFKYYSRNLSRIVLCFDETKVVGFYLYSSGKSFFADSKNLKYVLNVLQPHGIKSEECSVAILALVDKNYDSEAILHEMYKIRFDDAIKQGYKYSIININADYSANTFCVMSKWSNDMDAKCRETNSEYIVTGYKNANNEPIVIHNYA